VAQGFGHETEFDPLSALLEIPENFELVHGAPTGMAGLLRQTPGEIHGSKEKARPVGRALFP